LLGQTTGIGADDLQAIRQDAVHSVVKAEAL
jgi:hypothetical protein